MMTLLQPIESNRDISCLSPFLPPFDIILVFPFCIKRPF